MQPGGPRGPRQPSYQNLEAASLFCPKCGRAQPVRSKLLLVLPQGEKYAYFCRVCGEEVGSKMQEAAPGSNPWSLV
ncbi:MAG: cytoplasmic protein [Deltaproteobacteria bacterium]|nr:cytoplasmic protein [Deltaproteobacteria bacterium]